MSFPQALGGNHCGQSRLFTDWGIWVLLVRAHDDKQRDKKAGCRPSLGPAWPRWEQQPEEARTSPDEQRACTQGSEMGPCGNPWCIFAHHILWKHYLLFAWLDVQQAPESFKIWIVPRRKNSTMVTHRRIQGSKVTSLRMVQTLGSLSL